jgi:hypothetical protein
MMKIKLNMDLNKKKKGDIVDLGNVKGSDLTYWNNRVKDSAIDHCVTVLEKVEEKQSLPFDKGDKKKGRR